MTSRERLLRTLRREPVDRVPISTYELNGYNPDSFENKHPSYKRLMDKIRADTDCLYMWGWDAWRACPLWDGREERHADGSVTYYSRLRTPKGDLTKVQRRYPNVHTTWTTEHLLKTPEDIDRYLSVVSELFRIDEKKIDAAVESYQVAEERVGEHGIVMNSGGDPSAFVPDLFEFGLFTVMCCQYRDRVLELIDAMKEPVYTKSRIEAEHKLGHVYRLCGPEYYTPPYLPTEYFEEMVVPGCTETVRILQEGGIFVRLHCHGRIRDVLPLIVTTGARGLDPIEPPPDGDIELADVKRLYGDHFVLFGSTELKVLEHADADEVEETVRRQMEAAKAGGGYVMMPTAAPITEPLPEKTERNYFVWIDAGLRYGSY